MPKDASSIKFHSAMGMEFIADENAVVIRKLPNSKKARSMFYHASCGKFLVHKTSQALWRVSEDGKSIEPVFDSDVLTEEDLKESE